MMLGCCNYLYALYQVFDGRETKRDITISNGGLISTISLCTLTSSMTLLRNFREFLHMLWEAQHLEREPTLA